MVMKQRMVEENGEERRSEEWKKMKCVVFTKISLILNLKCLNYP